MPFTPNPGFPSRPADEYRDFEINPERDWVVDFRRVIHWYKLHDYSEFVRGQDVKRVEILPTMPALDEEAEAVEGALAYLYRRLDDPPTGLTASLSKEHRRLIGAAIESARMKGRIVLPEQRKRQAAAIAAVGAKLQAVRSQVADEPEVKDERLPKPRSQPATAPKRRATVNVRMNKILDEQPEAIGWSTEDFAGKLKCRKSTVHGTAAWQNRVMAARALLAADAVPKPPRRRRSRER